MKNEMLLSQLFSEESEGVLRLAFSVIARIGPGEFQEAIDKLNHVETVGPMLDPTAWLGGKRFDNSAFYKEVFSHCAHLARLLRKVEGAPRDVGVSEHEAV